MIIKKIMLAAALTLACQSLCAAPLLMDGKSTLYQRVLSTPSCVMKSVPNAADGEKIPAFSRYYVYERANGSLRVGPDTTGMNLGYIDEKCAVPWKAQTALIFTNSAGRNRALIMESKDELQKLLDAKDNTAATALYDALKKDGTASGVISQEPEKYVDFSKQFYLLPILDSEDVMFDDGNYTRALQIASVTEKSQTQDEPKQSDSSTIMSFTAAVVFVIDASISMQPYLDRTKSAIKTIVSRIQKENLQDSVQFGLVAFRSNTKAVAGLEYESKMFVNPGDATTVEEFDEKLKDLKQASVSSALFDEDAYSGINRALSEIDWKQFGGRYIVLVTDAGAIEGSNKLSSTGLDAKELKAEASHKGAAVYALHLLTDIGKNNHQKAAAQYKELTYNDVLQKPLYYPVNAGDVNDFGAKIDELSSLITSQVKNASQGKVDAGVANVVTEKKDSSTLAEDSALLGRAMQLAYLGRQQNQKAPDFFEGWMADRDLMLHQTPNSTPVVLLTKNELSGLKDVTSQILENAKTGLLDSDTMFSQLRSLAASMGRDPSALTDSTSLKIDEMGILGEYLDDLPYKSRIQDLDEDTWNSMGADEQNQTIEDLENKLKYYQVCNDDTDRWISLNDKADKSEAVYPVPLDILP